MATNSFKAYIVTYLDQNGEPASSPLVYRFDSASEMSAKTIALARLAERCTDIQICKVECTPIRAVGPGKGGKPYTWTTIGE